MEAYGKRVLKRLQAEGLPDIGEDALKAAFAALCDELIVEVEGNNVFWDDFTKAPILMVKDQGLKFLDKIDGEEG